MATPIGVCIRGQSMERLVIIGPAVSDEAETIGHVYRAPRQRHGVLR
jgi:hypothetical protein